MYYRGEIMEYKNLFRTKFVVLWFVTYALGIPIAFQSTKSAWMTAAFVFVMTAFELAVYIGTISSINKTEEKIAGAERAARMVEYRRQKKIIHHIPTWDKADILSRKNGYTVYKPVLSHIVKILSDNVFNTKEVATLIRDFYMADQKIDLTGASNYAYAYIVFMREQQMLANTKDGRLKLRKETVMYFNKN
jgi:hypothetical protein